MAKRTDIKSILIIGAGPIIIGQACEFDYSGAQACKALREEGYKVILVNSNPATIMTDPEMADVTYIEPITWQILERIIAKENPDAILPTMGGQTALNCALDLHKHGVLEKYKCELIGATPEAIDKAEDRSKFKDAMTKIGLGSARSGIAHSMDEAWGVQKEVGFPTIIRPSFTMGGSGGGIGGASSFSFLSLFAGNPNDGNAGFDGTGAAARFNSPVGVATDVNGNVYVADLLNHTIRKITPAGVVTTLAGTAGTSGSADGTGAAASFNWPIGVATDAGGNVYAADLGTIRKITPAGVVTTLAGTASVYGSADGTGAAASFYQPRAVATDVNGNVYVADTFNSTIRKITPAGVVTTLVGTAGRKGFQPGVLPGGLSEPSGIAVEGSKIYFSDKPFRLSYPLVLNP
jgi:hypothetical protein